MPEGPAGVRRPFVSSVQKIVFFNRGSSVENPELMKSLEGTIDMRYESLSDQFAVRKARTDVYLDGQRLVVQTDKSQLSGREIDTISQAVDDVIGEQDTYMVKTE